MASAWLKQYRPEMNEISYRRHRFPRAIIQHAVWLYLRFTLADEVFRKDRRQAGSRCGGRKRSSWIRWRRWLEPRVSISFHGRRGMLGFYHRRPNACRSRGNQRLQSQQKSTLNPGRLGQSQTAAQSPVEHPLRDFQGLWVPNSRVS